MGHLMIHSWGRRFCELPLWGALNLEAYGIDPTTLNLDNDAELLFLVWPNVNEDELKSTYGEIIFSVINMGPLPNPREDDRYGQIAVNNQTQNMVAIWFALQGKDASVTSCIVGREQTQSTSS